MPESGNSKEVENWEIAQKKAENLFKGLGFKEITSKNIAPEDGKPFEAPAEDQEKAKVALVNMMYAVLNHPALEPNRMVGNSELSDLYQRLATMRNFASKYLRGIHLSPRFAGEDLSVEDLTEGGNLKEEK